jgi:trk system potassium uptake protein TrkH
MSISLIENIDLLTCFFESASAIGTVGLTLGITPYLSVLSKIILILLMYLGRVGGMTLAFATMKSSHTQVKRPLENVAVG